MLARRSPPCDLCVWDTRGEESFGRPWSFLQTQVVHDWARSKRVYREPSLSRKTSRVRVFRLYLFYVVLFWLDECNVFLGDFSLCCVISAACMIMCDMSRHKENPTKTYYYVKYKSLKTILVFIHNYINHFCVYFSLHGQLHGLHKLCKPCKSLFIYGTDINIHTLGHGLPNPCNYPCKWQKLFPSARLSS